MQAHDAVVLAGIDPQAEAAIRAAIPEVRIGVLERIHAVPDELRAHHPAVAVVALGSDRERGFRTVRAFAGAGSHVIVVGERKDPDLILRAMREGAREFLTTGEITALAEVVRAELRPARAAGAGTVVAVFPTKGGVGATSVATNLAGGFARSGQRTCLLDLDLAMGDVLAFLDLAGGYAISDLIGNMQRIDRDLLDASLLRHRSGVHVLAQTDKIEEGAKIQPTQLTSLLRFLTQHFRYVVVDGLRTLDDHAVAALDACDQVMLVVTQEVPAVRRAQRCVQFLQRLGHGPGRMKLVVNRYAKAAEIKLELIAETVGLPVAGTLGSDYPALIRAINRGSLLADESPRSPLTKDFEVLGGLLTDLPDPEARPGLLKRLFK